MIALSTAASLLALVLGDIEALGSPFLLRDLEITHLSERDAEWWSRLLATRYSDVLHPALVYEVAAGLTDCSSDLLDLLLQSADRAAAGPAVVRVNSRFPLILFCRRIPHAKCLAVDEITDSHLHSGGSMVPGVFLAGLATRMAPLDLRSSAVQPSTFSIFSPTGRTWALGGLLVAARWSLRLMWYVKDGGDIRDAQGLEMRGLSNEMVDLVRRGRFWPELAQAATSEELSPFAHRLNCTFPDMGACQELRALLEGFRGMAQGDQACAAFLLGFMRLMVAIAGVATSRPGEGLNSFVSRFRLMGRAQRAAFGERELVEWKLRFMVDTIHEVAPTDQVVGAEFRCAFPTDRPEMFRKEVLRELAIHHAAFATFAKKRSMALSMPVSFNRRPQASLSPAEAGPGELKHVLAGCMALSEISGDQHGQELVEAIWAIDVSGPEIGSANWPFQVGVELLVEAGVNLLFSIHAGESFVSEINGLRRIGELFLGSERPRRIGHALALSPTASAAVVGRGRPPICRSEAIMDAAWLVHVFDSPEAHDVLYRLVHRVGANATLDVEAWVDAFVSVHSLERLKPLLIAEAGGQLAVMTAEDRMSLAASGSAADRAMAALSWSAPPAIAGCDVASLLDPSEREIYLQLSESEADRAREYVVGLVKANGTTIECCPTSNVTLAGLSGYADHPLWRWRETDDLKVTISSDDPLHFGNTVVAEVEAMLATGGDAAAVTSAVATGCEECSGGPARRLEGWTRYQRVVDLLNDPLVP